jgi:hypothetical protein
MLRSVKGFEAGGGGGGGSVGGASVDGGSVGSGGGVLVGGAGVFVAVGLGDGVSVGVAVAVAVLVGTAVSVGSGVFVGLGAGVSVGGTVVAVMALTACVSYNLTLAVGARVGGVMPRNEDKPLLTKAMNKPIAPVITMTTSERTNRFLMILSPSSGQASLTGNLFLLLDNQKPLICIRGFKPNLKKTGRLRV